MKNHTSETLGKLLDDSGLEGFILLATNDGGIGDNTKITISFNGRGISAPQSIEILSETIKIIVRNNGYTKAKKSY